LFRLLGNEYRESPSFLAFLNKTYIEKLGPRPSPSQLISSLDEILADEFFVCPGLFHSRQSRLASDQVFLYKFTQNRASKATPSWMGAIHGDELEFIFGKPFDPRFTALFSEHEKQVSDQLMSFVANMAHIGLLVLLYHFYEMYFKMCTF